MIFWRIKWYWRCFVAIFLCDRFTCFLCYFLGEKSVLVLIFTLFESLFLCISLHSTAFLCISLHLSAFHYISLHSTVFLVLFYFFYILGQLYGASVVFWTPFLSLSFCWLFAKAPQKLLPRKLAKPCRPLYGSINM